MPENNLNTPEPIGTNKKRRTIIKSALSVPPVIATFTSRPVHAVQNLSNITVSGNPSDCGKSTRTGGYSSGFWKEAQGNKYGYNGKQMWNIALSKAGFSYNNAYDEATFHDVFNDSTYGTDALLRQVMANKDNNGNKLGASKNHIIAIQGLLNAGFFDSLGNPLYIFTVLEFWSMYDNPGLVPPPYTSLRDLIQMNEDKETYEDHELISYCD